MTSSSISLLEIMEKSTSGTLPALDCKRLVEVLTNGEVQTSLLQANLNEQPPSIEFCKALLENIHFALNEAMSIAKVSAPENRLPSVCLNSPSPDSPSSDSSDRRNMSKRRKILPKWSNQVRVTPGAMDTPLHDGHSWRKYGQKDILGAMYPRAYYRCTHRNTQGCVATKQVQRSDSDPCIFDVIYRGEHTCFNKTKPTEAAAAATASSHENKQEFFSFCANLEVKIEGNEHEQTSSFSFPASSQLACLSSMDNNHFIGNNYSVSPCNIDNQQTNESELNEILISTMTSASYSNAVDIDFLNFNPFDPNFFQ